MQLSYKERFRLALWLGFTCDAPKERIVIQLRQSKTVEPSPCLSVVEWFFKEQQGDVIHGFDGVSLIEFDGDGKIAVIKEFESKAEHIAPYHQ